ncbi:MAG TPA: FAD:protein FMN transferase [Vicinamibacteria bacterium]|nr:FAD:protein FMN transferase [Vicinamibacteria bacterium]
MTSPLLLGLACVAAGAEPAREMRVLMGTTAEVQVWGAAAPAAALDAAFSELVAVDDAMSIWKETPLVRLNREGALDAPPGLLVVLRTALDIAHATDGAFDPTVGALAGARTDAERARQLTRVGYSRVCIEGPRVWLEPGTALDLGGIAKGYAADQALAALRSGGARAGLVNLGTSSLGVFGTPLVVEVPGAGAPLGSFRVEEAAVSSSGGSEKPGHVLDPRTGRPAEGVVLATVVAATGIEADALSTALYVRGAEGLALLPARGAEGFVLVRDSDGLVMRTTPGFAERHALALAPGVSLR